jgi:hypothetical protein
MENLQIIEQAINLAVTKGVFNLQEVDAIINALKELSQQQPSCDKDCEGNE